MKNIKANAYNGNLNGDITYNLKTLKITLGINNSDKVEDEYLQTLLDGAKQKVIAYIMPYDYDDRLDSIVISLTQRMYNRHSHEGMQKVYSVIYESDEFVDSELEILDNYKETKKKEEEEKKGRGRVRMYDWMDYVEEE